MARNGQQQTALERKEAAQTAKVASVREFLGRDGMRKQLEMVLPKHLTPDRLLRVTMTAIQQNPKLLDCTPTSLAGAVLTAAELGLEINHRIGLAYLVPYWHSKKKVFEAQLIPGYRGLINLARRSGKVTKVSAQVVYENDEFDIAFGLSEKLEHKPLLRGDRGEAIGAYAVFHFVDEWGEPFFDYLPAHDILKIARRSATYDSKTDSWTGPWNTDREEMFKKTVIRRASKMCPMSVEDQLASSLDDRFHAGESQIDLFSTPHRGETIDIEQEQAAGEMTEEARLEAMQAFTDLVEQQFPVGDEKDLAAFVAEMSAAHECSPADVQIEASRDFDSFWTGYKAWVSDRGVVAPTWCPKEENDPTFRPDASACEKCTEAGGKDKCPAWAELEGGE
jgi:recombination protein RecT